MFYVFNDFQLEYILTRYKSVRWLRTYNDLGQIEIEMPFDKEVFSIIKEFTLIFNKEADEWGIVLSKKVTCDDVGDITLVIGGCSLNYLLTMRVANYTGTSTLKSIITGFINNNFINPSDTNRKINLVLGNMDLKNNPSLTVELDYSDVFSLIKELSQLYNVGFNIKCDIDNKQFVFNLYEGVERKDVVFSQGYSNVKEQEYFFDSQAYKNTCFVDIDGNITTVNSSNKGLSRFETYTTGQTDVSATETGRIFLNDYKKTESFDTVIDTASPQFIYLQDWNIGDIVTTKNSDIDVVIQKNILEIEEYYDDTGRNITVNFGDKMK